jgi:ABC-type Na+ transport system ATPase subunit NatA
VAHGHSSTAGQPDAPDEIDDHVAGYPEMRLHQLVDAGRPFGGPANQTNVGNIVAGWPIRRTLAAIYTRSRPQEQEAREGEIDMPAIEVHNLRKRYGDRIAVQDESFTVERGEIFGIIGPNGAGKTTMVECIEGLRVPGSGSVSVLGLDPRRDGVTLRQRVGAQLQESALPDKMTVWEALDLYSSYYQTPANGRRLLEDLGLGETRNTRYGKLSGGQKQRLSIALALVGSPEVAILDELTTGLDPHARRETWGLIEQVRAGGSPSCW